MLSYSGWLDIFWGTVEDNWKGFVFVALPVIFVLILIGFFLDRHQQSGLEQETKERERKMEEARVFGKVKVVLVDRTEIELITPAGKSVTIREDPNGYAQIAACRGPVYDWLRQRLL